MSVRRFFLDRGVGETRGVVTLAGRPARLIIDRDADPAVQRLGARVVARVRTVEQGLGLAFLELGEGPDAVLNLAPEVGPVREGGWAEIEIKAEARGGKGANARWLGPAEGPVRLLSPAPSLEQRLISIAKGAQIIVDATARAIADAAQDEALETVFPLHGGGDIAVELTRALVSVDIDVGARSGGIGKRLARATNLAALAEAARVLRLKGLGGLIVIDLAGRGHDGAALLAAARAAFAMDNPGVAFGPISRFGTLELTIPRRLRSPLELLTGDGLVPTRAMALLRALEREAIADGGGRFEALAEPPIAEAATPYLKCLTDQFGGRLFLRAVTGRQGFEMRRI